jgi:Gelsolin repeat
VEEVAASLNSEDVFVLTTPKAIYVWKGNSYSDTDVDSTFLFLVLPCSITLHLVPSSDSVNSIMMTMKMNVYVYLH